MASVKIQQCLFGIFFLVSALSIAGALEMYTTPKVVANCGQRLTLNCAVLSKDLLDIKQFYWMEKKDICEYTAENQTGPGFQCEKLSYDRDVGMFYNYSLTIFNVELKHKGTYHCKLRTKDGVKNGQTILRVQKCVGNSSTDVSPTVGSCTFKDVYPEPIVFWNLGYENLTNLAETKVTKNPEGTFTAVSTLKLKKDPSIPYHYNCSLFMALEKENNETQVQWVRSLEFSGGHKLIGHCFGVMLAMVLGMLLA